MDCIGIFLLYWNVKTHVIEFQKHINAFEILTQLYLTLRDKLYEMDAQTVAE